jgi:hypothetical protein
MDMKGPTSVWKLSLRIRALARKTFPREKAIAESRRTDALRVFSVANNANKLEVMTSEKLFTLDAQ